MRILQCNNYADAVGGAEVYAQALTRELRRRGHTVAFFGTTPDREVQEEHLTIVRRPRYDARVLTRDPAVRTALEEVLRRLRPELIHVHNVYSLGIDVLESLGSAGVPIVQTVHDFGLLCPNSWCVRADGSPCRGGAGTQCFQHGCQKNYPYDAEVALHTLLRQRTLIGIVDLALCPSLYLTELTRASGVRDVRHLNYFIDPIAGDATAVRRDRELVFIGRLEPEKGVEHLLEAMPLILRSDPAVRLTIVGGGSQSGALLSRAESLGLGRAVTFLSHVPREELGRFYSTATACVLPSIWSENSPLVAYECLAAGLPMLASRVGGIPELAEDGHAGFTFTPRDPRDLAEKALRLLAIPADERRHMSAAMRQRASAFRAEPHLERIESSYRDLLQAGPRARKASLPIDADFLHILGEYGLERGRLADLFHEHVGYIRQLEQRLSEPPADRPGRAEVQGHSSGEVDRSLPDQRAPLDATDGPRGLVLRLSAAVARRLKRL